MTRKRFIKLAMSKGYQRNTANLFARKVIDAGSYQELYESFRIVFACKGMGTSLSYFNKAVMNASLAIANRFAACMNGRC